MLRGAISGFGEVAARGHLAGWRSRPELQIVAVHDPVAARRHLAINLIRNVRVYDDLDLMLEGERLDFVDIASPPAYHAATILRSLQAGAHVLVEKPLCLKRLTLVRLQESAFEGSRILMCVHNWKQAPPYRRTRELISSGRIGEVINLSLVRDRTGPAGQGQGGDSEGWRLDAAMGGGILIDHGWHAFYLMRWLIGGARPLAIAAKLESDPGSSIEHSATMRVDFETGQFANCRLSWRAAQRRTVALVNGTRGSIEIEGNRLRLRSSAGASEECIVEGADDDSYHPTWFAGVAADFVQAMAEGSTSPATRENLAEAECAASLIEAARSSNRQGGSSVDLTASPTD